MPKSPKLLPCIISSREGLIAVVAEVVCEKLEMARLQVVMEQRMADIQKEHQQEIIKRADSIHLKEAGVHVYCTRNRAELFPGKEKSIDMPLARVGFRKDSLPTVEKTSSSDTWDDIAYRIFSCDWGAPYVTSPKPGVDKKALQGARDKLSPEQLEEAGIRLNHEEKFFITPKSEIVEGSTQAV